MDKQMRIRVPSRKITAIIEFSNESPNTVKALIKALPIQSTLDRWGDEALFRVPIEVKLESNARVDVEVGEIGYWDVEPSICIFFGPTPVSTTEKPKAYSPVNVLGKIIDVDPRVFSIVEDGDKVIIENI